MSLAYASTFCLKESGLINNACLWWFITLKVSVCFFICYHLCFVFNGEWSKSFSICSTHKEKMLKTTLCASFEHFLLLCCRITPTFLCHFYQEDHLRSLTNQVMSCMQLHLPMLNRIDHTQALPAEWMLFLH